VITNKDVSRFTFDLYRKHTTTPISREVLQPGTEVETSEGKFVCTEPSRLAQDAVGNVYAISERVLKASYEPA
jgi:hypothetical protein